MTAWAREEGSELQTMHDICCCLTHSPGGSTKSILSVSFKTQAREGVVVSNGMYPPHSDYRTLDKNMPQYLSDPGPEAGHWSPGHQAGHVLILTWTLEAGIQITAELSRVHPASVQLLAAGQPAGHLAAQVSR